MENAAYGGTPQFERTRIGDTTFTNCFLGVTSSTKAGEGTTYYYRAHDGGVLGRRGPDVRSWYYLTDRLGSITGVTDTDGWTVNDYDPYGGYIYDSDAAEASRHVRPLAQWRYTGAWLDGDSVAGNGFHKIGQRHYDDQIGRWTQADPLKRVTHPVQPAEATPYYYVGCNHHQPDGYHGRHP